MRVARRRMPQAGMGDGRRVERAVWVSGSMTSLPLTAFMAACTLNMGATGS